MTGRVDDRADLSAFEDPEVTHDRAGVRVTTRTFAVVALVAGALGVIWSAIGGGGAAEAVVVVLGALVIADIAAFIVLAFGMVRDLLGGMIPGRPRGIAMGLLLVGVVVLPLLLFAAFSVLAEAHQ